MATFTKEVEVVGGQAEKEAERIAPEKWGDYFPEERERFTDILNPPQRRNFISEFFGDYPPFSDIIHAVRLVRSTVSDLINTPTASEFHS